MTDDETRSCNRGKLISLFVLHCIALQVFLEYADLDSSTHSKTMLHLTWFRGRQVIAVFYPEDKFADGNYDG